MSENNTNTVGFSTSTPNNLVIDSGALYKNYGIVGQEKLISATAGGNEFTVSVKTRDIKVDGVKNVIKGLRVITATEVTLKANLLECTTDILQMALLGNVDTSSDPDYDIITGKTAIADTDYITNIALVGRISGSVKPVIIILKNVLNNDGLKFKTEDDKDNVLPVTFTAFGDSTDPTVLPFEIRYPKVGGVLPFIMSETPIINGGKIRIEFTDTVAATVPFTGFAAAINGTANVVTACVRDTNATNTIMLTLTTPPTSGQLVTITYTQPVTDVNRVKSLAGGLLATFPTTNVVNN